MSERRGSAESVVLPVPERPKKSVSEPSGPSFADEWSGSCPASGILYLYRAYGGMVSRGRADGPPPRQ